MFIRVLLSVEFCFTLKTYLKGAPFYNASACARLPLTIALAHSTRLAVLDRRTWCTLNQSMTMEQLLEAEQRAAEWIRKMRKIPPSSIEDPPEHRPTRDKGASTA